MAKYYFIFNFGPIFMTKTYLYFKIYHISCERELIEMKCSRRSMTAHLGIISHVQSMPDLKIIRKYVHIALFESRFALILWPLGWEILVVFFVFLFFWVNTLKKLYTCKMYLLNKLSPLYIHNVWFWWGQSLETWQFQLHYLNIYFIWI